MEVGTEAGRPSAPFKPRSAPPGRAHPSASPLPPPSVTHPEGKQHSSGVRQRAGLRQAAEDGAPQVGLSGGGRQGTAVGRSTPRARAPVSTPTCASTPPDAAASASPDEDSVSQHTATQCGGWGRGAATPGQVVSCERPSSPSLALLLPRPRRHTHRLALVVRGPEAGGAIEDAQGPQGALVKHTRAQPEGVMSPDGWQTAAGPTR